LVTAILLLGSVKQSLNNIINFFADNSLASFSEQLFDYPLPPNTIILEKQTIEDRLHGGNGRTNYAALMLLESELSLEELNNYYEIGMQNMRGTQRIADFWDSYQETYEISWDISAVTSPEYNPYYNHKEPFVFDSLSERNEYSNLYFVSIVY